MKLFFGCSRKDKEFVDNLMCYLNEAYEIKLDQMYNCYVGKNKFPVGKNYNDYIKKAIRDCDRSIIIVSQESLKRKYCLCELGAAWGLDKNIILIIIAPCKFDDLFESPFMGIQAWYVNLKDQKSISDFIDNMSEDEEFSELKKDISQLKRRTIEEEFEKTLFELGQKGSDLPPLPDYTKCNAFHEDGNASTLTLTHDKEKVKAKIDYSSSKPNFVGFAFDLRDADWTGLAANDCSLAFWVEALPTIKAVSVEFKKRSPGSSLEKIGTHVIDLAGNPKEEIIRLREICDAVDDWEHMKELTFVFHKNDITEMGTFTLSDLGFRNLP